MKRKLTTIYHRIWFCLFGEHQDSGFTSVRLPGGNFRFQRCLYCHTLTDVVFLADNSPLGQEFKVRPLAVEATPGITAPIPVSLKKYLDK